MTNLIRGEFYKLRKSKYFIGMIFLSLVAAFFIITNFDDNMQRLRTSHPELVNGMYSIHYSFSCILFTSFILALFAGEFIAKDLKSNISKSFIYGYKRSKIIISKLIVFIIISLFIELIYTTILVIYASMNYSFCADLNMSNILYLIRLIFIGVLYNVGTISIVAMIAVITKSNLITVVSPIILLMTFSLAFSSYPYISHALLYLPYMTGIRAINIFSSKAEIIRCIISSVITFIITIGGSLLYVKHEDIK